MQHPRIIKSNHYAARTKAEIKKRVHKSPLSLSLSLSLSRIDTHARIERARIPSSLIHSSTVPIYIPRPCALALDSLTVE